MDDLKRELTVLNASWDKCSENNEAWLGHAFLPSDLCGYQVVSDIIAGGFSSPAIWLVDHGRMIQIPETHFVLEDISLLVVNGLSIYLRSMHVAHEAVSKINHLFEDILGFRFLVNGFVSPPFNKCLNPHRDDEDIVIMQVEGKKIWSLNDQFTVELERGDMLYMPAGTLHEAVTECHPSIHLVFGVGASSKKCKAAANDWVTKEIGRSARESPSDHKRILESKLLYSVFSRSQILSWQNTPIIDYLRRERRLAFKFDLAGVELNQVQTDLIEYLLRLESFCLSNIEALGPEQEAIVRYLVKQGALAFKK